MIKKPFYRMYRPLIGNSGDFKNPYFLDHRNIRGWSSSIRAFEIIVEDFKKICEYIDPTDENFTVYSHRIYELFLRSCTEIESNMKNILDVNGYIKRGKNNKIINIKYWNISDYKKLEKGLKLSNYKVVLNFLNKGLGDEFSPYQNLAKGKSNKLVWYQDYNNVKHDRDNRFHEANLENLIFAICGLFVILFAQYGIQVFNSFQIVDGYTEDNGSGLLYNDSSIFGIIPPEWKKDEKYHFNWDELSKEKIPFVKYSF